MKSIVLNYLSVFRYDFRVFQRERGPESFEIVIVNDFTFGVYCYIQFGCFLDIVFYYYIPPFKIV